MRNWNLQIIIRHFDDFLLREVDFAHLPERRSEEYRQLVLRLANDVMFDDGRYNQVTEWILEMFDEPEVVALVSNLAKINRLTAAERVRLTFYLDVKEVCYPLFRGQKVDWATWPWQLTDGRHTLQNQQLWDMICRCQWPCLSAAILSDFAHQIWMDEEEQYSCVASQDAADSFSRSVESCWNAPDDKTAEADRSELVAGVSKCADDLWSIENHMLVGRLLGFDQLEQSIYDAYDTFIDTTYRYNQVICARQLAAWLREHWTMGERHPSHEAVEALHDVWQQLMTQHDVRTPDDRYAWTILTLDVLGMSMLSPEQEIDDDPWGEAEYGSLGGNADSEPEKL